MQGAEHVGESPRWPPFVHATDRGTKNAHIGIDKYTYETRQNHSIRRMM